ncbi:fasciclin domain-containing protein [Pedobacter frigoris]|uniref:Uncharacterized protein n=1 Tax=Pedobacter frigoris TaxID=2571272 RepID=A0A4U1CTA2_9SPHI|nr:fasciclin domain-containing protein [Pedobacter frigoris]TKC09179.1 hypothetical protein FA047_03535 [Pedobacter frigoris]
MKKSTFFSKCLLVLAFAALTFQIGCKREEGFYDTSDIVNQTDLNTYEYLKSKPGVYDSLLFLIDKLNMQNILKQEEVTLFAPSNTSFQIAIKNLNDVRKAQGKPAIYLNDIAEGVKPGMTNKEKPKAIADSSHLDTMVSRYIIKKLFVANDFAIGDGQTIYSVRGDYPMHGLRTFADAQGWQNGGSAIIEFANTKRSIFVPNWSKTTTTSVNIKTKNGIVHLLRPDHVFGFDEFVNRLTLIPPPPNLFTYPTGGTWFIKWDDVNTVDGSISPGEKFIKVLDNNFQTKMLNTFSPTNKIYMNWIPSEPKVANSYTITSANDSKTYLDRDPKAWRLEATNDPVTVTQTWVQLDIRQDQKFTTNYQQKIFDFVNTVPYKQYRLVFLQNNGGNTIQISEWTMNLREIFN